MHKSKCCIDCSRFARLNATKEGKGKRHARKSLFSSPRVNAVIGIWRRLINFAKVKKRHTPYKFCKSEKRHTPYK
jgi:hypothetical protein